MKFDTFVTMGFNLTERDRKIIGVALSSLTSFVMILTYLICQFGDSASRTIYLSAAAHTPLAQDLIAFEGSHPTLSIYLSALASCCLTAYLVIFTTRRTLYPQGVMLQPIIFTSLMLAAASLSAHPILVAVSLTCAVMGATEIYSVNHTSYRSSIYSDTPTSVKSPTSRLVVGAMYFGVLSLINPAAIVLVLLFPVAIFCFDRYFYEIFTPVIAFFIPMGIELYLRWWLYDANVDMMIHRYIDIVEPNSEIFTSWTNYTSLLQFNYPTTFLVLFSLLLSGLGLARVLHYSITARAHQRFVFSVILFAVGLITTTLSGFTFEMLLIIAAPVAMLITAALINLRHWVSAIVYTFYIILTFVAIIN